MEKRVNNFEENNHKRDQLTELQNHLDKINGRFDTLQSNMNPYQQNPYQNFQMQPSQNQYNMNQQIQAHKNYMQQFDPSQKPVGFLQTQQRTYGNPIYKPPPQRIPDPIALTSVLNPFRLIVPQKYDDNGFQHGVDALDHEAALQ